MWLLCFLLSTHNLRLNLFLLLLVVVLGLLEFPAHSSSFGTTGIGLAQSLKLLEIIPTSSSCFTLWSTNLLCFKGTVLGFGATGGPSVRMSSSIKLVLPISVADLDTILLYSTSSSSSSHFMAIYLCYVSIWDRFRNVRSFWFNCKLVEPHSLGSNWGFLHKFIVTGFWAISKIAVHSASCRTDHLISWICSHISAGTKVAIDEFFTKLEMVLLMFKMFQCFWHFMIHVHQI